MYSDNGVANSGSLGVWTICFEHSANIAKLRLSTEPASCFVSVDTSSRSGLDALAASAPNVSRLHTIKPAETSVPSAMSAETTSFPDHSSGDFADFADEHIATWGLAIGSTTFSDRVKALDQSSYAGELHGALVASFASARANKPIQLLIDNTSVVTAYNIAANGGVPSRHAHAAHAILATRIVHGSSALWVPSHGKKPEWRAPPSLDTEYCRALNDEADKAASYESERIFRIAQRRRQPLAHRKQWSHVALVRLHRASSALAERVNDTNRFDRQRHQPASTASTAAPSAPPTTAASPAPPTQPSNS